MVKNQLILGMTTMDTVKWALVVLGAGLAMAGAAVHMQNKTNKKTETDVEKIPPDKTGKGMFEPPQSPDKNSTINNEYQDKYQKEKMTNYQNNNEGNYNGRYKQASKEEFDEAYATIPGVVSNEKEIDSRMSQGKLSAPLKSAKPQIETSSSIETPILKQINGVNDTYEVRTVRLINPNARNGTSLTDDIDFQSQTVYEDILPIERLKRLEKHVMRLNFQPVLLNTIESDEYNVYRTNKPRQDDITNKENERRRIYRERHHDAMNSNEVYTINNKKEVVSEENGNDEDNIQKYSMKSHRQIEDISDVNTKNPHKQADQKYIPTLIDSYENYNRNDTANRPNDNRKEFLPRLENQRSREKTEDFPQTSFHKVSPKATDGGRRTTNKEFQNYSDLSSTIDEIKRVVPLRTLEEQRSPEMTDGLPQEYIRRSRQTDDNVMAMPSSTEVFHNSPVKDRLTDDIEISSGSTKKIRSLNKQYSITDDSTHINDSEDDEKDKPKQSEEYNNHTKTTNPLGHGRSHDNEESKDTQGTSSEETGENKGDSDFSTDTSKQDEEIADDENSATTEKDEVDPLPDLGKTKIKKNWKKVLTLVHTSRQIFNYRLLERKQLFGEPIDDIKYNITSPTEEESVELSKNPNFSRRSSLESTDQNYTDTTSVDVDEPKVESDKNDTKLEPVLPHLRYLKRQPTIDSMLGDDEMSDATVTLTGAFSGGILRRRMSRESLNSLSDTDH